MNPWKIIGWMVLAFILFAMYSCGRAINEAENRTAPPVDRPEVAAPVAAPEYQVQVVSVECIGRSGRDRALVTIKNSGTTRIPSPKVFVQFTDAAGAVLSAQDSYFSPIDIPPGAIASARLYSSGSGAAKCVPTAIQDGEGNPVQVTR